MSNLVYFVYSKLQALQTTTLSYAYYVYEYTHNTKPFIFVQNTAKNVNTFLNNKVFYFLKPKSDNGFNTEHVDKELS
jgi:hypothetical protein